MARETVGEADITIDPQGRVSITHAQAAARMRAHAGRWRVATSTPEGMLLRRSTRAPTPMLAGEITEQAMLLEVLQMIANACWTGEFHHVTHTSPPVSRAVTFDRGVVIFASSTAPPERLGEVIYRRGRVSRADLDAIVAALVPERRIGEDLIERGVLRPTEVFSMLQCLVEEVFYNLVRESRGSFTFAFGIDPASQHTRVHLATGRLMMEAVQRVDEWAWFRAKIPDGKVVPVRVEGRAGGDDPAAARMLAAIDGARTLEELARALGVSEFDATKALHLLLASGSATLAPRESLREALDTMLGAFNEMLAEIHATADAAGMGDEARETLGLFMESGSAVADLLAGAGPSADGTLDVARFVENLEAARPTDPPAAARQCLHDYVTFALFAAGTVLRREAHQQLAQRVQQSLSKLK